MPKNTEGTLPFVILFISEPDVYWRFAGLFIVPHMMPRCFRMLIKLDKRPSLKQEHANDEVCSIKFTFIIIYKEMGDQIYQKETGFILPYFKILLHT